MSIQEYQAFATLGHKPGNGLVVHSLGIVGEVGEVIDCIKKGMRDEVPIDREHLKEELGDVLWYVCNLATDLHISMDDVIDTNIEKLKRRYSLETVGNSDK